MTRRGHYSSTASCDILFLQRSALGMLASTAKRSCKYHSIDAYGSHECPNLERSTRQSLEPRLERAFDFAAAQVRTMIERDPDFFPIYTRNGRWRHDGEGWTDWCAGFHAGMMWLLAERTGELEWRQHAEHYSRLLEHKQYDRDVHDLGFIFLNTYLPWYRASGDARLREVLITAGRTLALRYNERGRYLRSFVAPESLFIDIMMNVPLIFYAAAPPATWTSIGWHVPTATPRRARWSAPTVRPPMKGSLIPTPASFCASPLIRVFARIRPGPAAWRGRFTASPLSSAYTGRDVRPGRRRAAMPTASSPGAPESLVPPWDFDVPPGPDRIDDSSAAAIAASGLWDLAALLESRDPAKAQRYRDATLTILDSLCTDQYLAWTTPGWEGILKHGVYHFHKKLGVDESVMWGDFFFLEAIAQGTGRSGGCASAVVGWPARILECRLAPNVQANFSFTSRRYPPTCYTMARARELRGRASFCWLKLQGP